MSRVDALAQRMLAPLDWTRNKLLKLGTPVTGYLAANREARVAVGGVMSVVLALALAWLAPLWALALTPVVLGLPHILADLRYTLVRSGLSRDPALWIGPGIGFAAVTLLDCPPAGYAAIATMAIVSRGAGWRRAIVLVLAGLTTAASLYLPRLSALVLTHLHNVVGLALWMMWRRRSGKAHLVVLAAIAVGLVLIAVGLAGPSQWNVDADALRGLGLAHHREWLAGEASTGVATKLVVAFAFLQSVHYGIWLRLIPEEDRDRATPRTFRASYQALVSELGTGIVFAFGVGTAALLVWSAVDLRSANLNYLRFASFHAYLEFGLLAFLWLGTHESPRAARDDA